MPRPPGPPVIAMASRPPTVSRSAPRSRPRKRTAHRPRSVAVSVLIPVSSASSVSITVHIAVSPMPTVTMSPITVYRVSASTSIFRSRSNGRCIAVLVDRHLFSVQLIPVEPVQGILHIVARVVLNDAHSAPIVHEHVAITHRLSRLPGPVLQVLPRRRRRKTQNLRKTQCQITTENTVRNTIGNTAGNPTGNIVDRAFGYKLTKPVPWPDLNDWS